MGSSEPSPSKQLPAAAGKERIPKKKLQAVKTEKKEREILKMQKMPHRAERVGNNYLWLCHYEQTLLMLLALFISTKQTRWSVQLESNQNYREVSETDFKDSRDSTALHHDPHFPETCPRRKEKIPRTVNILFCCRRCWLRR